MPQCPVCQSEVPDDFGLIDCPECKTPLFIQLDGSVQSMQAETAGEPSAPVEAPQDNIADVLIDEALQPMESASPVSQSSDNSESLTDDVPDVVIVADAAETMIEEPLIEEPLPEEPVSEEPLPEELATAEEFLSEEPPAEVSEPPAPIHDLSQLANSTDTDAQAGSIRYNISVAGIDTAEIRKEFRDLISDRHFLWDVDAIVKSIRSGKVKMQNITAVKAILLVQRLRGLPVHVRWEQHVVHQD